jgi:hypothetical protein
MTSPTISVVLHHAKFNYPWKLFHRYKKIADVYVLCSPAAGSFTIFPRESRSCCLEKECCVGHDAIVRRESSASNI